MFGSRRYPKKNVKRKWIIIKYIYKKIYIIKINLNFKWFNFNITEKSKIK